MDSEGRLVFWKSGVWEGGAPTLSCNTCKKRRADRMSANDSERPQGYVLGAAPKFIKNQRRIPTISPDDLRRPVT